MPDDELVASRRVLGRGMEGVEDEKRGGGGGWKKRKGGYDGRGKAGSGDGVNVKDEGQARQCGAGNLPFYVFTQLALFPTQIQTYATTSSRLFC